jgi:transcription antitermination factor NusG
MLIDDSEPRWYAAYTYSHHEKRVAAQLQERAILHFLPLYQIVRNWRNGRAHLQLPIFPGYVFVRIVRTDRVRVLEIASIVRLVGTASGPIAIPEAEIGALQRGWSSSIQAEPYPYLTVGSRVRIRDGPFSGAEGFFVRTKQKCKVVISLETIMRSVALEIDASDVEPCHTYFPWPLPMPNNRKQLPLSIA